MVGSNFPISVIGRIKNLAKDTLVYGGLSAFTKFFSLFLTPLFTSVLTKDEYGVMDLLNPLLSIAGTLIILGTDSAIARFYYRTESVDERRQVINNGFWVQVFTSSIVLIFFILFKGWILQSYLKQIYQPSQDVYLIVMAFVILFSTPVRFAQNVLIWTFEKKRYVLLTSGFVLLNFGLISTFLYVMEDKLLALYLAQVPSSFIFAIVSIKFIRKYLHFNVNWSLLSEMMRFGTPLVLLALIPALIPALDRSFVSENGGLEQVANYGLGYRIATLIALPISSINTAIGPFIMSLHKEENAERLFNLVSYAITLLVSSIVILAVTVSPLIVKLLANRAYLPGVVVVAPLGLYFLFDMLKNICASGIDLSMKTYWNIILHPLGLTILYFLLFLLTPLFGIQGAASALFLSSMINFNMFTFVGRKLYPFRYNQAKLSIIVLLAFVGGSILGMQFESKYFYLTGIILTILFPIIGFFVFFTQNQRVYIVTLIKTKLIKISE